MESMKIKSQYDKVPNKFHLEVQKKYRTLIKESKRIYKRSNYKKMKITKID